MSFQKIIVYKIPPGGEGGLIASSRPIWASSGDFGISRIAQKRSLEAHADLLSIFRRPC